MSHTHATTTPIRLRYLPAPKITPGRRRRVYERDDWTCQYCGRRIPPTTPKQERGHNAPFCVIGDRTVFLELDHIMPRALGGKNTDDNLRSACSPCNRRKSDSTGAADWPLRIALAVEILNSRPAIESTALSAARALLGVSVTIAEDGTVSLGSPAEDAKILGGAE
jgi:5-methylcytosine-specific restriction endonuclease McrA